MQPAPRAGVDVCGGEKSLCAPYLYSAATLFAIVDSWMFEVPS